MAAVEVTISGVLFDKLNRTTQQVVLIGEATLTGLGVGGGPMPPGQGGGGDPPGIWGGPIDPSPGHPLPPPVGIWPSPGRPAHPIVLPPDGPPVEPPTDPPSGNWEWGWNPNYGWHPVYVTGDKPQPVPPPS